MPVTAVLSTASFKVLAFDSVVNAFIPSITSSSKPVAVALILLSVPLAKSTSAATFLRVDAVISLIVGSVPPICAISLYSYSVSIVRPLSS